MKNISTLISADTDYKDNISTVVIFPAGKHTISPHWTDEDGDDLGIKEVEVEINEDVFNRIKSTLLNDLWVDYNHKEEEAAGWINDIGWDNRGITATVRWTPEAVEKIRGQVFKYISPQFNVSGEDHPIITNLGNPAFALTNDPAFRELKHYPVQATRKGKTIMSEEMKDKKEEQVKETPEVKEEVVKTEAEDSEEKEAVKDVPNYMMEAEEASKGKVFKSDSHANYWKQGYAEAMHDYLTGKCSKATATAQAEHNEIEDESFNKAIEMITNLTTEIASMKKITNELNEKYEKITSSMKKVSAENRMKVLNRMSVSAESNLENANPDHKAINDSNERFQKAQSLMRSENINFETAWNRVYAGK